MVYKLDSVASSSLRLERGATSNPKYVKANLMSEAVCSKKDNIDDNKDINSKAIPLQRPFSP